MNLAWLTRGAATAYRSRRQMELRGVTPNGHPLWSAEEVGDLIGDYPNYSLALIKLARRTRPAAHSKASRIGITRPKAREWDENEIPRLRRLFPSGTRSEIEVAFPDRTYSAIAKAANARGIYREPKPYKPAGIPLVDQILVRARSKRWSLSELDQEAGEPGYFSKRKWKLCVSPRAHFRAVAALGGRVHAQFRVTSGRVN